jgi:hypothetical protein
MATAEQQRRDEATGRERRRQIDDDAESDKSSIRA